MLTPDQAQTGLTALIGGGGISAILVAFFSFLTAARNGRQPETKPLIAFTGPAGVPFDHEVALHLGVISFAVTRLVAINEITAEQETNDKGFRDRLESKVDRLLIEAIKAASQKPG